ncbi:MAG: class I SAM-dependent methyltransferase [Deltaproteobacteria bacterium]|nr:MAG: class I SAM-dependent methyltransferase [Deltaproteobacteria bacterium]
MPPTAMLLLTTMAVAWGCAGPGTGTPDTTAPAPATAEAEAETDADADADAETEHAPHAAGGGNEHHEHHHHGHMQHRFADVESYAARWNDPARDAWQRPADIVAAMAIEPGMIVADLGVGTGYFVPHLAEAVGEEGAVLAVDIEQGMLDFVEALADEAELRQVRTVLAAMDDPRLEPGSVDRILTVNTWHHIAERAAYGVHLREALRSGGALWVVDFHEGSTHGPPAHHRIPAEVVVAELEAAGFEAEVISLELERQYVVVGRVPAP